MKLKRHFFPGPGRMIFPVFGVCRRGAQIINKLLGGKSHTLPGACGPRDMKLNLREMAYKDFAIAVILSINHIALPPERTCART